MSDIQAHELPKREGVYDEVELENLAVAYDERLLMTREEWLATIDYEAAAEALRMVRAFTAEEAKPVVDAALGEEER